MWGGRGIGYGWFVNNMIICIIENLVNVNFDKTKWTLNIIVIISLILLSFSNNHSQCAN